MSHMYPIFRALPFMIPRVSLGSRNYNVPYHRASPSKIKIFTMQVTDGQVGHISLWTAPSRWFQAMTECRG